MDQNLRQSIQTNTFYYFLIVMVLTTISQLSTMMVIVFGNISGKELLVAASVVGPTIIGAFGIIRILTNFMVLLKDMDETISKTNYGKEVQNIPLHILRFVFLFFLKISIGRTFIHSSHRAHSSKNFK